MSDFGTIFDQGNLPLLKRALSAYALRHRVIADNVANVSTPGYRAQEVRFEEFLAGEYDAVALPGSLTQPGHLPVTEALPSATPRIEERSLDYDNGLNDVDVEREMLELGENQLMYQMATRVLSRKYQGLRTAITGNTR